MLSRLGTKGLLKGLLQKRFRALGLFLASYELWRRIRISEGRGVSCGCGRQRRRWLITKARRVSYSFITERKIREDSCNLETLDDKEKKTRKYFYL